METTEYTEWTEGRVWREPRNTLSERSEGAEAVGRVLKGRPSGRECTEGVVERTTKYTKDTKRF